MMPTKNNASQGKSGILTETSPLTTENREIDGFLWPATDFAIEQQPAAQFPPIHFAGSEDGHSPGPIAQIRH